MRRADLLIPVIGLLLAGCGGRGEGPDGNVGSEAEAVNTSPTVSPSASPAARPVVSSVPETLTVTTNEPFHSVRIDGDVLTLTGVDTSRRVLRATGRPVAADARQWDARDDRGSVRVRVVRAPCADDMSGAPRDFTAMLTLGGAPIRGCGFVGTPAPPPEEAATGKLVPAVFHGKWQRDAAACARPAASIEGLRITPDELWFHESVGKVTRVEPLGPGKIRITANHEGEGERWTTTQTLRVEGERLTVTTDGRPFSRIRCPA